MRRSRIAFAAGERQQALPTMDVGLEPPPPPDRRRHAAVWGEEQRDREEREADQNDDRSGWRFGAAAERAAPTSPAPAAESAGDDAIVATRSVQNRAATAGMIRSATINTSPTSCSPITVTAVANAIRREVDAAGVDAGRSPRIRRRRRPSSSGGARRRPVRGRALRRWRR